MMAEGKRQKAIIITGAAGGLGRAIVEACLNAFPECIVLATDVHEGVANVFSSDRILTYHLDVTDESSILSVKDKLEKNGIKIWGLVNNAGVSDFFPVSEEEKDKLEKIFAINTFGPVNMVRCFLPDLIENKGRVVQISSESVRLPAAFHPYAASKIAQEALSVSLRNELALKDVRLSIIRPGAINTPFLEDLMAMKERIGNGIYKEYLEKFSDKAPTQIHNITTPDKVAKVVLEALTSKRPKRYYRVNNNPKLRIAALLPHSVRDFFMRKMLTK